ncbi:MAG: ribosome small subunit-dependent GTPase A [Chlamydiales bacterium]|nr:ribosome small subunit-dependent GTPase A [Chlamydiales bacterium]
MKDRFSFEEEYHSKDRKEHRKERKRVTLRDRSKFKKSDQDQLKKRQAALPENLMRGRVLAISPEGILVDASGDLITCSLKGALKKEKGRIKNLIAVGDFVHFEMKGEKEGAIAFIEERSSVLSRADNYMRQKEQLIAVNIDQVLITTSVVFPVLKPALIDRYIIAARKGKMEPIIVVNKIDLLETPPENIPASAVEKERELYRRFLQTYVALGISVFPVSTHTGEGIGKLRDAMHQKTSVFSGQSGVGKSSLINCLMGTSLEVGKVIARTNKGAHTTSATHLVPIEGGGFCIDTPGIKSFGLWDLSKEEIQSHFSEIQEASAGCKFLNCSHRQEPVCAVKAAVENGEISPLRFASYCALIEDLSSEHTLR